MTFSRWEKTSLRTRARSAFTLLEVLLVTVLLVVLASVMVPSVTAMTRRGAIMTASGDVTRFLADNRRRAIDESQRRWVRFESLGRTLLAGPEDAASDLSFTMSERCKFGEADEPERLPDIVSESLASELQESGWSPSIWFYPDGTASDEQWALQDDSGRRRTVSIRALTGRVDVSPERSDDAT